MPSAAVLNFISIQEVIFVERRRAADESKLRLRLRYPLSSAAIPEYLIGELNGGCKAADSCCSGANAPVQAWWAYAWREGTAPPHASFVARNWRLSIANFHPEILNSKSEPNSDTAFATLSHLARLRIAQSARSLLPTAFCLRLERKDAPCCFRFYSQETVVFCQPFGLGN